MGTWWREGISRQLWRGRPRRPPGLRRGPTSGCPTNWTCLRLGPYFSTNSGTCQHAMALARVRGEGLRWPSAGFRREPADFSGGPVRKTDLAGEWLGIGFP